MNYPSYPQNPDYSLPQQVYINPAPIPQNSTSKKTKSESNIDLLHKYLSNPELNEGMIQLRKSVLGTKYVTFYYRILFWDNIQLIELIKAAAYSGSMRQITEKEIKIACSIISGNPTLWIQDTEAERILHIRIAHLVGGGIAYFFSNNNYFTIRSGFLPCKAYFPEGMVNIPAPHPDYLNKPLYYNYQSSPGFNYLIDLICKQLKLPEECFLLVLSWLIQSIIGQSYTLLELTGESKSGKTTAQEILRKIIDPNIQLTNKAPRSIAELERQTMEGHVLSYDNVEILPDEVQIRMAEIMTAKGARITTPIGNAKSLGDFFVNRPILLNSDTSIVTNERLLTKSLTIELKPQTDKMHNIAIGEKYIDDARLELLILTKYVANFHPTQDIPICNYLDMHEIAEIGMKLSMIIYNNTNEFEAQLNLLATEQIFASLEENKTANLIHFWAIDNPNSTKEMAAIDWLDEIKPYIDERLKQPSITPKKFGSDLKRAAPVLRKFGIDCTSLGKRGSNCKWRITTAKKIEMQDNFFETSHSSMAETRLNEMVPEQPKEQLSVTVVELDRDEANSHLDQDASLPHQKLAKAQSKMPELEVRKHKKYAHSSDLNRPDLTVRIALKPADI
ncbi:hypothetical protein GO003_011920 [Methylicorpusculum oleiharenae]|uniref:hypothetical protein n=1 Tax=Methylicorpusculum oleiharenae TaxID=1338687 RepID=UPI001358BBAE|nr:hypothetical protein [Methylicorpusculum oleiharenae]MCD2451101.1 hypothetical protein [Methylicorpusculum oleiharenae]